MKSQEEQFSEYCKVRDDLFCSSSSLRFGRPSSEYGLPISLFCKCSLSFDLSSGMADMFEIERDGWRVLAFAHKFRWEQEQWDASRDHKVTEFVALHNEHGALSMASRCGIGDLSYAVYCTSQATFDFFGASFKVTADGHSLHSLHSVFHLLT